MQLLIAPKLAGTENYWLRSMRTDLRAGQEIQTLMAEYERHRKSQDYAAVMDLNHAGKLGTDGGGEKDVRCTERIICRGIEGS